MLQMATALRNARLDIIEETVGLAPILKIRTGPQPADCAQPDSGLVLATIQLPYDWLLDAEDGVKSMSGSWQDNAANATGSLPGHFRLYAADDTTCFLQGSVGLTGSSADMTVDALNFVVGQYFTVTLFTLYESNA